MALHTCNIGTGQAPPRDPVTGAVLADYGGAALTGSEKEAVQDLLRGAGARGPDEFGFYGLEFPDGASGELLVQGLQGSAKCAHCSMTVRSLCPQLVRFLFELIRAGNLFLLLGFDMGTPVVASHEQRRQLAGHTPEVLVMGSPAKLQQWLFESVAEWQRIRPDWFERD